MENIKSLYYERFIQHVVEAYSPKLKAAKPGHCMKITGLALKELRVLLPLLRPLNDNLEVYILSETEKGSEFRTAQQPRESSVDTRAVQQPDIG